MKLINGLLRIFVLFLTIERGSSPRIVHTDIVLELELWIQFTVAYAVEDIFLISEHRNFSDSQRGFHNSL